MTDMTITTDTSSDNPFSAGYLDGEIAAETGLSPERAHAIADMAETYDELWALGYYEGYWARHAVTIVTHRATVRDEINAYLADRDNPEDDDIIWGPAGWVGHYALTVADTDTDARLQMRRDGLL